MKPVHFRGSMQLPLSETLVSFLLVIVLAACGANTVATSSPHPSPTANNPTNASIAPALNASEITTDIGSLHIQSADGFQCPYNPVKIPIGNLVLATDRLTYSQNEINQMISYVGANRSASGLLEGANASAGSQPTPIPPTLRWVSGGSVDLFPGGSHDAWPCGADLKITNTGSTPVQIPRVGVRLKESPRQNTYQYRLIDICSLIPTTTSYCPPQLGNDPHCSAYIVRVQLGKGENGSVFSAQPMPAGSSPENDQGTPIPCGVLTVAPTTQVDLIFFFSLAPDTPKSIIYQVVPEFTIDTANGEQVVLLSQLTSTLSFATASQFPCYQLHGTTFVLGAPAALNSNLVWCM